MKHRNRPETRAFKISNLDPARKIFKAGTRPDPEFFFENSILSFFLLFF